MQDSDLDDKLPPARCAFILIGAPGGFETKCRCSIKLSYDPKSMKMLLVQLETCQTMTV
jgi:hypothetical protein